MKTVREVRADQWIALLLLGFCAVVSTVTVKIKALPNSGWTGATFIPWLMIALIAICAVLLLIRALTRQKQGDSGEIELPDKKVLLQMAALVILMVVYAMTLMTLGYIWTTLATFVLGLLILGERNPWLLILFPVAMTAAVYYGFTELLSVWLP